MAGRLRLLGQTVLARHAPAQRVGGLRFAQHVLAARTPERIVESSTRLARGRSIATPAAARGEEPAAIPRPAGMSDFAARWIFGDGPPEGIPIAGEAALAGMGPSERPAFLVERDEREAQEALAAKAEIQRRSQPVPRGRVDEVTPGFRLARRPAPAPAVEIPPAPAASRPPAAEPEKSPVVEVSQAEAAVSRASVLQPSPVVPEPPAARAEIPAARNVLSTRPPAARTPPPVERPRVETQEPTSEAAVQEPSGEPTPPSPAPGAPQVQPDPAPLPRAKLTLARAAASERTLRPAIALHRREPERAEALDEIPAAEAVAPPAPPRSLLGRAIDAVFRRETRAPGDPPAGVPRRAEARPVEPVAAAPALARSADDPWEEGAQPSAAAATAAPPPAPTPAAAAPAQGPPAPAGPVPTPYPNEASGPGGPGDGGAPPSDPAGAPDTGAAPEPPAAAPAPVSTPVPLELVEPAGPESSSAAADSPAPTAGADTPEGSSEAGDTTSPESAPASAPGGTTRAAGASSDAAAPAATPPALPAAEEETGAGGSKVTRAIMRPFRAVSRSPAPEKTSAAAPPPGPKSPAPSPPTPAAAPPLVQPARQLHVARSAMPRASSPAAEQDGAPVQRVAHSEAARRQEGGTDWTASGSSGGPASSKASAASDAPRVGGAGIPGRPPAPPRVARTASAPTQTGAGPTSRPNGRPAIRLVSPAERPGSQAVLSRSESRREQPATESPGRREAPTSGARLAAATGAILSQTDQGFETVEFPRPAGIAFAPAVSLMRAEAPADGSQPTPTEAATATGQPVAAATPAAAQGGGGGGDIEEIYTQVIDRLRRELLADRERMGDLLGDLP